MLTTPFSDVCFMQKGGCSSGGTLSAPLLTRPGLWQPPACRRLDAGSRRLRMKVGSLGPLGSQGVGLGVYDFGLRFQDLRFTILNLASSVAASYSGSENYFLLLCREGTGIRHRMVLGP